MHCTSLPDDRFPGTYRVGGMDVLWQADLRDLMAHQQEDQGYRYLLCFTNVFCKMFQPKKGKDQLLFGISMGPEICQRHRFCHKAAQVKKRRRERPMDVHLNIPLDEIRVLEDMEQQQ